MPTIQAGAFKAKCLKLLDKVAETGEPLVITKHGKPVAKLVPIKRKAAKPLLGFAEGVKILGDIVSPIDIEWEATTDE